MPTCGVSFELTKDISNKPQRQHDRCINEILKTHFSINELSQINKIRITLQLLTLADVTDDSGKKILPNIYNGVSHRTLTLTWPRQPIVRKFLPIWKRACKCLQNHLRTHALGNWISTH